MNCKYKLIFLFLCGFTGLTVSEEECKENQLEGTSCTMKLKKSIEKTSEVKWTNDKSVIVARRKKNKDTVNDGFRLEVDGSLTFINIRLTESGLYDFRVYNSEGTETARSKVPKPDLKWTCNTDGNVTLTCNAGNGEDLQYTWFDRTNPIENKHTKTLILPVAKVNNPYSCSANNPISEARSENKTVTCESAGLKTLFGFDFWIMVSILAGGGALLLLLISVLLICACRSCKQREKCRRDEEELKLRIFNNSASSGQNRCKSTARGQPAPPIPPVEPITCSPTTQTPPQPKANVRARPPPPPQDDNEDDPPPLPRPRKNNHRERRNQAPYQPME
ncbi:T-cell surface antigen CD2 [Xyrauchen texanus]|uniref:T-cell surface antigen CD2 n=1 Tax=Xyrauchen texanus TaxID=154827 RepID=UPI002242C2D5|nr:T-cell surface antigen CD2 [Xyrauchen texanus]